jgi:hypothetical protein
VRHVQAWLKKEFGKEFKCRGDMMKHGNQEDTWSCGICLPNAITHNLFDEPLLPTKTVDYFKCPVE